MTARRFSVYFMACLTVALVGLAGGGCASSGIVMTPSVSKAVVPDNNRAFYKVESVSFGFGTQETPVYAPDWKDRGYSRKFASLAEARYPGLFKNDPGAVPIHVRVDVDQEVHQGAALGVYLCTLCVVGGIFPSVMWSTDWQVKVRAEDAHGGTILSTGVQAENRGWWTILTPLGLIDCPGESDAPKVAHTGVQNGPGFFPVEHRNYVAQCLVDLLAADLLKQDPSKLPVRVPVANQSPPATTLTPSLVAPQPVTASPQPMY